MGSLERGMSGTTSVALCTHNGALFIQSQLRSILEQGALPNEVVVSDDASTDATIGIVRSLADDFSSADVGLIILQNLEPLGVTANFEQAIAATTGEIVLLSDQDDIWHPDRLSRALSEFEARRELDLLFTDARLIDEAGRPLEHSLFDTLEVDQNTRAAVRAGAAFPILIKRNIATGATIAFRRRLIELASPFPDAWLHDEWLTMIAASTGSLDLLNEQLIDYRQHSANQIGVRRATLLIKVAKVFEARGDRNLTLSRRAAQLALRLDMADAQMAIGRREAAHEKAEMELARLSLPTSRWRRLGPILQIGRKGWYSRYASQGRLDMLRDLLQSHG
jgi:glycosyltransferase involved in cell wall biosynthesis